MKNKNETKMTPEQIAEAIKAFAATGQTQQIPSRPEPKRLTAN
jgi:hypothetical protein